MKKQNVTEYTVPLKIRNLFRIKNFVKQFGLKQRIRAKKKTVFIFDQNSVNKRIYIKIFHYWVLLITLNTLRLFQNLDSRTRSDIFHNFKFHSHKDTIADKNRFLIRFRKKIIWKTP